MIQIIIGNETEEDRNRIFQLLRQAAEQSSMEIHEIRMKSTLSFVLEDHSQIRLCSNDILYFEYINRKIKIVTEQEIYICIHEKIGDVAEKMKKYGFVMCHKSFVVNLLQIEKLLPQTLLMKNGDYVCLAQKRAAEIRKELRSQSGKILL